MALDYFYGSQAEQFVFYRIPKVLFTDKKYSNISLEAKVLYGLMLDRVGLSRENGWIDEQGRVFIIYSIEEIMKAMNCGNKKVSIYLNELETACELIERKRRGLGLPNIIYVKNFIDNGPSQEIEDEPPVEDEGDTIDLSEMDTSGCVQADTSRCVQMDTSRNVQADTSGNVEMTRQEVSVRHANKTELSKTERSNNNINTNSFAPIISLPVSPAAREVKRNERKSAERVMSANEREEYRELLEENLELDTLRKDIYPLEDVEEIFELILDTVCTSRETVRICGEEKPSATVRSRFLKLNSEHVRYVLDRLRENTTDVRNPKQYLLAMLYNAPMTMGSHYTAMVSHDMHLPV